MVGVDANALSVDVEEYFQVSAFEGVIERADWHLWPSRVERATETLLDVFAENEARATFFTLGWVAERFPNLVKRMVGEGHEVACHGQEHRRITDQSRVEFREDLQRSKRVLEDAAGIPMRGFRAASFSIAKENSWAFHEIERAGFVYSSSIYPIKHDHYGIPDAPRCPFRPMDATTLTEIPVSTVRIMGRNFPVGGGGFFRLFPYRFSSALVRRVREADSVPVNMYFHPWDFDPEQPRPTGVPARTRIRHYLNQRRALGRLRRLLVDFTWAPFCEVYAGVIAGNCEERALGKEDDAGS